MEYIRSFLVLFVLLSLLLAMVPGEQMKRYIRFFSGVILAAALLGGALSALGDSDSFLELIEYETFSGRLSELSKDNDRVAFLQEDFYLREYETALAEDVAQLCSQTAETYGYAIAETSVALSDDYTVESVSLRLEKTREEGETQSEEKVREEIKKVLTGYYDVGESTILIEEGVTGE